jgi:hypothetical protein
VKPESACDEMRLIQFNVLTGSRVRVRSECYAVGRVYLLCEEFWGGAYTLGHNLCQFLTELT